jgi:hypothetical protein
MAGLVSNIYPITNLHALSSKYRLYRIKGLKPEQDEYYQNCQRIVRILSYKLQNPVTIIEQDELPYLVVRDDATEEPETPFNVVDKKYVEFIPNSTKYDLNFSQLTPIQIPVAIRFLNFVIQGEIRERHRLWQPKSGTPFFNKSAKPLGQNRMRHPGFVARPIVFGETSIGICVDVTATVLDANPLPRILNRNDFWKWRNTKCIYRNGHQWYEIEVADIDDDYTVSTKPVIEDGETYNLLDLIVKKTADPKPIELTKVHSDGSVIIYYNSRGEERSAPSELCYPIYGTHDLKTGASHAHSILDPDIRKQSIQNVVRQYLNQMKFDDVLIQVDKHPLEIPNRSFVVPDIQFGNGKVLSVRKTPDAIHTDLDMLGQMRLSLIQDNDIGFYDKRLLDFHYVMLPQSVYDTYGKRLIDDLKDEVNHLFPQGKLDYNPTIVTYNDYGQRRSYQVQARIIEKKIKDYPWKPNACAIVMLHPIDDKKVREEDPLGGLVMRLLIDKSVKPAIIHSKDREGWYQLAHQNQNSVYVQSHDPKKRGRLLGYLRNVAINKVLLTNWRWPFILATPLHADIIVGLDVKNHTAGLVVVSKNGQFVRFLPKKSNQKEKLEFDQARSYLRLLLLEEITKNGKPVKYIVIHRDGTLFETERKGFNAAIKELKAEGKLPPDANLTIVEISKSSMISLRLFNVTYGKEANNNISNPQVGDYFIANKTEAFLCSTGRAFARRGTSNPLNIHYVEGEMSFEMCLEDIYALTTLAWTRPEDCSRDPITVKLNDRFLREQDTSFDGDVLDYNVEDKELVYE